MASQSHCSKSDPEEGAAGSSQSNSGTISGIEQLEDNVGPRTSESIAYSLEDDYTEKMKKEETFSGIDLGSTVEDSGPPLQVENMGVPLEKEKKIGGSERSTIELPSNLDEDRPPIPPQMVAGGSTTEGNKVSKSSVPNSPNTQNSNVAHAHSAPFRDPSLHILEATLVEDHPAQPTAHQAQQGPVYDAVLVSHQQPTSASGEGTNENSQSTVPWWKRQSLIVSGLLLIIVVMVIALAVAISSQNSGNQENDNNAIAPSTDENESGVQSLDEDSTFGDDNDSRGRPLESPSQSPQFPSFYPVSLTNLPTNTRNPSTYPSYRPSLSLSPTTSTSLRLTETPTFPFVPTAPSVTNPTLKPTNKPIFVPAFCSWAKPIELDECISERTNLRAPTFWDYCGYTVDYSQWYALNGTGRAVTASTCNEGTNFDTRISVFTHDCGSDSVSNVASNNGQCAGSNDDFCGSQSSVTFDTEVGTTYYFGVDGANDSKGKFAFRVSAGETSQAETCPSPTCNRAPFCNIMEDIFVGTTVSASTTDVARGFFDLEMCGYEAMISSSSSVDMKAYHFISGGDEATARLCNLDESYDITLMVLRRGCDGSSNLCPVCHAVKLVNNAECEDIRFVTEANDDYYLIVTTHPSWWGPSSFNLTVFGEDATPPPTLSLEPTQSPVTGVCGCTCEVDADEDTKFECRVLELMPSEHSDIKCSVFCQSVSLSEECSGYEVIPILTCPADYVLEAQCTCYSSDGSCTLSETTFGQRVMEGGECSRFCQLSDFASLCGLEDGDSFTSSTKKGLKDPVFVKNNPRGFEVSTCNKGPDDNDFEVCEDVLVFNLEELHGKCSCSCSTDNCYDVVTGISSDNTRDSCVKYCQQASPCAFGTEISSKLVNCSPPPSPAL